MKAVQEILFQVSGHLPELSTSRSNHSNKDKGRGLPGGNDCHIPAITMCMEEKKAPRASACRRESCFYKTSMIRLRPPAGVVVLLGSRFPSHTSRFPSHTSRSHADVGCKRLLDVLRPGPGSARHDRHEERPRRESDGHEDGQSTHGPDQGFRRLTNKCEPSFCPEVGRVGAVVFVECRLTDSISAGPCLHRAPTRPFPTREYTGRFFAVHLTSKRGHLCFAIESCWSEERPQRGW